MLVLLSLGVFFVDSDVAGERRDLRHERRDIHRERRELQRDRLDGVRDQRAITKARGDLRADVARLGTIEMTSAATSASKLNLIDSPPGARVGGGSATS
ncbi:MAG: hypothetical protein JO249_04000 [Acidobacteria bacterium]|nr:hypothetical protein [Acidobacteriota bacterium]